MRARDERLTEARVGVALAAAVGLLAACGGPSDGDSRNKGTPSTGGTSSSVGGSNGVSGGSTSTAGTGGSTATTGGSSSGGTASNGGTSGGTANGRSESGGSDSGGTGGTGASGGSSPGAVCENDRPVLEAGTWVDITPPGLIQGEAEHLIGQGLTVDPTDPATLYWGTTPFTDAEGGLYKTTNAGCTWVKMGDKDADTDAWDDETTYLDMPLHVRIDPNDVLHMYAGDGVRGATTGFWVSTDGGNNWKRPAGWQAAADAAGSIQDIYDVAVDPTDFGHVLVSSHSPWEFPGSAGILESTNGGDTWIVHEPESTWGAGHSVDFLYDPGQAIGNADTWLVGTQGNGYWRTTNAGDSWTQVSTSNIFHGGGDTYYSKTGVLYATSGDGILRSTNNGASFTNAGSGSGNTGIIGDGNLLYTAPAYGYGAQPVSTSPEDDGLTWTAGSQTIDGSGPFESVWDADSGILYSSMWFQGVWALKVE